MADTKMLPVVSIKYFLEYWELAQWIRYLLCRYENLIPSTYLKAGNRAILL